VTYRVLRLDCGGSSALIQAAAAIALYNAKTRGHGVIGDFDLVAASRIVVGGSSLENLPFVDLSAPLQDRMHRETIFSVSKPYGDRVLHNLTTRGPKFCAAGKLVARRRASRTRGVPLSGVASGLRRGRGRMERAGRYDRGSVHSFNEYLRGRRCATRS